MWQVKRWLVSLLGDKRQRETWLVFIGQGGYIVMECACGVETRLMCPSCLTPFCSACGQAYGCCPVCASR